MPQTLPPGHPAIPSKKPEPTQMKRVAVLGGGPAGAFAAERLARAGLETLVFDEKLAWEKPCGGGLTYKAYQQYPFLIENDTPKRVVTETCLAAPKAGAVTMGLTRPLVIYSRLDLNRMLLERARTGRRATGKDARARNRAIRPQLAAQNPARIARSRFLHGGHRRAQSAAQCRHRSGRAADTMYALGYYVPSQQDHIDIQFLANLEGYIWVFPRCGHLSVGICGKGEPAQSLRARLERYMDRKGHPL